MRRFSLLCALAVILAPSAGSTQQESSGPYSVIKTAKFGGPGGIFYDSFNRRVYILSHAQPYATVIDGASGNVVGTIDLGGAPEQAVSDGKGHVYVDIEDMANIAVVDAKTMAVTAHYDLTGKG